MAKPVDLRLVHNAEQMRLLLDSPAWKVLAWYLEGLRDEALRHLVDPRQEDQMTHHWRGAYTAHVRALGTPEEVIAYEKAQRQSA